MNPAKIDFVSEAFRANPLPYFESIHGQPIEKNPSIGCWVLSRHEQVLFALNNPHLFSSSGMGQAFVTRIPELLPFFQTPSLIALDPPDHAVLRRRAPSASYPKNLKSFEGVIEDVCTALLRNLQQETPVEFVEAFAMPLPVTVIATMLGIDARDMGHFKRWSDHLIGLGYTAVMPEGPERQARIEAVAESQQQFWTYLQEHLANRPVDREPDLIDQIISPELDQPLSTEEILIFIRLLLVAGNETTTNLLSLAILNAIRFPEIWKQVQADPGLCEGFIEETLRYSSPALNVFRITREPVTIDGTPIPAGERVCLFLAAANHDPQVYASPQDFILQRLERKHLAFGHGIHHCLGVRLARMEAVAALRQLCSMDFHLADNDIPWLESILARGPKALWVQTSKGGRA